MATSTNFTSLTSGDVARNSETWLGEARSFNSGLDRSPDPIHISQPLTNVSDTTGGVAALLSGATVATGAEDMGCYVDLADESGIFALTIEEGTGTSMSVWAPATAPIVHFALIAFNHRGSGAPFILAQTGSFFVAIAAAGADLTASKANLITVQNTLNVQYTLRLAINDAASSKTYRITLERVTSPVPYVAGH